MKNATTTRLFALTIFLGSFLGFQVQLILGKELLPWFGGSPAVWSTSLFFFMSLLLGAYAAAALLVRLQARNQGIVQLLLILTAGALIVWRFFVWNSPVTPPAPEFINPTHPLLTVLILLLTTIGLPYVLLSTTSTLLQAWSSFLTDTKKSSYRFYILSNAGSLLGILTYPFLIEPFLSTSTQGMLWSWAYLFYSALFAGCTLILMQTSTIRRISTTLPFLSVGLKKFFYWTAYAFLSSLALIATTNYLTQSIAPLPFLWVVPLALYLIGFIIVFAGWYRRLPWLILLYITSMAVTFLWQSQIPFGSILRMSASLLFLFACAVVSAGESYRTRPNQKSLAWFYLAIALGGALGSGCANFLAPLLFTDFWEFPICVLTCLSITLGMSAHWLHYTHLPRFLRLFGYAVLATGLFIFTLTFLNPALSMAPRTVEQVRNFYGVLHVTNNPPFDRLPRTLVLKNGQIIHGMQFPDTPRLATTYYSIDSGIGRAITALRGQKPTHTLRIGGIGLGVGTIAAHCILGDSLRFYELNPAVIRIALEDFTYLKNCQASIDIIAGDARIQLEHETPQQFDLMAIDAFSGDAIPVHLLTTEAFQLYLSHLYSDGIIAIHITNRYLDLQPVLRGIAVKFNLAIASVLSPLDFEHGQFASHWILLAPNPNVLQAPEIRTARAPDDQTATPITWTDDYSSLLPIFKLQR